MKKSALVSDLNETKSTDWIIVFDSHPSYSSLDAKESPLDETDKAMKAKGFDSYTFNDLTVLNKAG
jgi:hypothetical protein